MTVRPAEEIPEEEREYLVPGRKDVFKADGIFYMYMGKWAGWENPERLYILPNGTVSGASGKINPERVIEVAGRILMDQIGRKCLQ